MNPWAFFDTKLFINLDTRKDRLIEIGHELFQAGIEGVNRIPGVISDNPTKGFNEAQHNALMACKGNSVIFEDDVTLHNYDHLGDALNELPYDWDMLYLGANIVGTDLCDWPTPEYYSEHLRRVKQAWTTHAIAYSEIGVKKILADWDYTAGQIYDDYLRCAIEEKLNAYIINPMIADQRPGYSDIWNCATDYGFFKQGNERMAI